jgi:hypothetical protein
MLKRFIFQAPEGDPAGGGGGQGGAAPAEWLKPFGEHAKPFESFKEPAELAKAWTDTQTELTTLKGKKFDFRSLADPADDKASKFLSRFTDDKAFMKTVLEAQDKLRSGDFAKPLPKDATAEQKAEWRAANGIPADAKEYFAKLPDGLVIGKDDQPMFDAVAGMLHENNVPPSVAQGLAKWYYDGLAQTKKEENLADEADRQEAIKHLRNVWGNDYATNNAIIENWLEGMGENEKALFKDATLGDGTRLFNSPKHVEFLASIARQINPLAHLLPFGGEGSMKSLDSELAGIKKLMADKSSEYWKGPKSEAMQKRYRELIAAQGQLKKTG